MQALSDAEIVARCRAGDAAAWNELVERFSRYVYAICVQAFHLDAHAAEDVFQDVFARVYERLDSLRDDDAIRPWIAQLTRNRCIDQIRAARREVPDEIQEEADDRMSLLDDAMTVRASLAQLGDNCREILDRFFARDESYRTIGEALGIASGTIASRISRCLSQLRAILEGRNQPEDAS